MRIAFLLLVAGLSGCAGGGATTREAEPDRSEAGVRVVEAAAGGSLLEVLQGRNPALSIRPSGGGLVLTMRRTGEAPVIVIDGHRQLSTDGRLDLMAEEVAKVEVLTSLSETLIYGAEAGRRGVVRITTRLHADD